MVPRRATREENVVRGGAGRPSLVPVNVTLRGLGEADIPAWNRLLAAVEAVDRTGEHYNEADLEEEMANPDLEPGRDIVGAFAGEGAGAELVGYFCVYPRTATDEYHKVALEGAVRPDLRGTGIGTVLAVAMRRRAVEVHAARHPDLPAFLTARGLAGDEAQESLLDGIGLRPERWALVMRADLSRIPPAPPAPEGLDVRSYHPSMADALREAHNAAFVDHPHFTPWSDTMWKQWVTEARAFRPDLSLVAFDPADPERVVGYVQTMEYDAYEQQTGRREAYVAKVGTRREYRGRGLAAALLGEALAGYRHAGYDEASLDVDSENPTGALGIYRRAGFEVETRWTVYTCLVPPGR